jgi:hypothetical protein
MLHNHTYIITLTFASTITLSSDRRAKELDKQITHFIPTLQTDSNPSLRKGGASHHRSRISSGALWVANQLPIIDYLRTE